MTALALLNARDDPHLLIDTLVTADGHVDEGLKGRVWIPASGHINRNCGDENDPTHIVRLGRKTFLLAGGSGIIGYAGTCSIAFKFWSILSEKNLLDQSYGKDGVELLALQNCLKQLSFSELQHISFAGVVTSAQGHHDLFIHNCIKHVSKVHGECYLAGSGAALIGNEISLHEQYVESNPSVFPTSHGVSATAHLTDVAATRLLYQESSTTNGTAGTALALNCGGFYERYALRSKPVTPLLPVLDIHIEQKNDLLIANRAYFCEMMFSKQSGVSFMTHHLSLAQNPTDLGSIASECLGFEIKDAHGVLIPNVFKAYDDANHPQNFDGRLTADVADLLFADPIKIQRVNICLGKDIHNVLRSFVRSSDHEPSLAIICMKDRKLFLSLSVEITYRIRETLSRIQ